MPTFEDDPPMPLSSRDLLPESLLMAIETPAFAFEPVKLPAPAPAPAPETVVEAAAPEPKAKRSRKQKKEGGSKKRGSRSKKPPP
jgi:hypothetical protein